MFVVDDILMLTEAEARHGSRGIGADDEHDTAVYAGVQVAIFNVNNVRDRNSKGGDGLMVERLARNSL